jgi:hypothetical protein
MYAANSEQAVKMRRLALKMRHEAQETDDLFYRCMFQNAAIDLESEAERVERKSWRSSH